MLRTSPTVLVDAAHNPPGMAATVAAVGDAFAFTSLVAVVACLGDKDVAAMLEVLEPAVTSVVVTTNSSPRALSADDLHALAVEVFGEDRVAVEDRLDDAIDTAVRLAEEGGEYGSLGVLVTGSVVHGRRGAHPAAPRLTGSVAGAPPLDLSGALPPWPPSAPSSSSSPTASVAASPAR